MKLLSLIEFLSRTVLDCADFANIRSGRDTAHSGQWHLSLLLSFVPCTNWTYYSEAHLGVLCKKRQKLHPQTVKFLFYSVESLWGHWAMPPLKQTECQIDCRPICLMHINCTRVILKRVLHSWNRKTKACTSMIIFLYVGFQLSARPPTGVLALEPAGDFHPPDPGSPSPPSLLNF